MNRFKSFAPHMALAAGVLAVTAIVFVFWIQQSLKEDLLRTQRDLKTAREEAASLRTALMMEAQAQLEARLREQAPSKMPPAKAPLAAAELTPPNAPAPREETAPAEAPTEATVEGKVAAEQVVRLKAKLHSVEDRLEHEKSIAGEARAQEADLARRSLEQAKSRLEAARQDVTRLKTQRAELNRSHQKWSHASEVRELDEQISEATRLMEALQIEAAQLKETNESRRLEIATRAQTGVETLQHEHDDLHTKLKEQLASGLAPRPDIVVGTEASAKSSALVK